MADDFESEEFRPFAHPRRATPPPDRAPSPSDASQPPAEAVPIFAAEPIVYDAVPIEPPVGDDLVAAEAVDDAKHDAKHDAANADAAAAIRAWSIDTPGDHHSRRAPLPEQRRRWPLIVALVVGVPVGGVALIALLGWVFVVSATDRPVTDKDRNVVMKAEDLAVYLDGLELFPSRATIRKVRYLDGSYDVEYEYDATELDEDYLYVLCTVTVERTATDARSTYAGIAVAESLGMSFAEEVTVRTRNDLFRWGDASTLAIIESEHIPVGNIFRARSGRNIFDLTFYGVYFDDRESLAELLTPHLERMKNYEP